MRAWLRRDGGEERSSALLRCVWVPAYAGMTEIVWTPIAPKPRHPGESRGPDTQVAYGG